MVDEQELRSLAEELNERLEGDNVNVISECRRIRPRFEQAMNGHAASSRVGRALQDGAYGTALSIIRDEILAA